MRTNDIYISGIGTFLPDTMSVASAVEQGLYPAYKAEQHGWVGVAVAGETPAPEMALQACHEALKRANHDPRSMDLLLYASCWHQGPDGWNPQFYLQHHLLGDLLAVEIRHGCAGLFTCLELAASYLAVDPARQAALVVSSDNFGTPLVDRWNVDPGFIPGDASAAAVLTKTPGFAQLLAVGSTSAPQFEEIHRAGEPLFPPGATTATPLDFGKRRTEFRERQLAEGSGRSGAIAMQKKALVRLEETLTEAGVTLADITKVVIPNNSLEETRELFMKPLGLPMSQSTWDFGRTIGHAAASDQLLAVHHLVSTGQAGPGDHLLLLGLAPGITFSCAVIKILETPQWITK